MLTRLNKKSVANIIRNSETPEEAAAMIMQRLTRKESEEEYALMLLKVIKDFDRPVQYYELRKMFYGYKYLKACLNLLITRDLVYHPRRQFYRLTEGGIGLLNENATRSSMGLASRFPAR